VACFLWAAPLRTLCAWTTTSRCCFDLEVRRGKHQLEETQVDVFARGQDSWEQKMALLAHAQQLRKFHPAHYIIILLRAFMLNAYMPS